MKGPKAPLNYEDYPPGNNDSDGMKQPNLCDFPPGNRVRMAGLNYEVIWAEGPPKLLSDQDGWKSSRSYEITRVVQGTQLEIGQYLKGTVT